MSSNNLFNLVKVSRSHPSPPIHPNEHGPLNSFRVFIKFNILLYICRLFCKLIKGLKRVDDDKWMLKVKGESST